MSLEADLLDQARRLVNREPRRPKQASLRRGVSAAYYALFHLLVREATVRVLRGQGRDALRRRLGRAFSHKNMKDASAQYASFPPAPNSKLATILRGLPQPQTKLINVADAFVQLQQARHEADYKTEDLFTRQVSNDLVNLAEKAFEDWKDVRNTPQAEVYLMTLLTWKELKA